MILEKWQKIENLINQVLGNILRVLSMVVSKVTPAKIKRMATTKKTKKHSPGIGARLIALQRKLTDWALGRKKQIEGVASNAQGYILSVVLKARSIKVSSFKPKGVALLLTGLFTPIFLKARAWLLSLKPTTIAIGATGIAVFSLASIQIYQNSKQIAEESGLSQAQNLVEDLEQAGALSRRPASHGKVRQILTVTNVNMPVYLGGPKDLTSVLLDFTIITTNRTVKNFLDQNELLVRNKLTNSVHPILPEFTLTTEGKDIIKEKIRNDLNELIRELDESGKYQDLINDDTLAIESVHVNSLLAN